MDFIKILSDYADHAKPAGGFFAITGGIIVIVKGLLNLYRDFLAIKGETYELKKKLNKRKPRKL